MNSNPKIPPPSSSLSPQQLNTMQNTSSTNSIYFRESTGHTYQFPINISLPITDILAQITHQKGDTGNKIMNVRYKGKQVDKDKKICDIDGVQPNTIIHIVLENGQSSTNGKIQWIYISYDRQLWRMHFSEDQPTVDEIISKIQLFGIPQKLQILIFQSVVLKKGLKLKECGIKNGDIVSLAERDVQATSTIPVFDYQPQEQKIVQPQQEQPTKKQDNIVKIKYLKPRMNRRNSDLKSYANSPQFLKIGKLTPQPRQPNKKLITFQSVFMNQKQQQERASALFEFNSDDYYLADTPTSPAQCPYNFYNFQGFIMPSQQPTNNNPNQQQQQQEDIFKALKVQQNQPIQDFYFDEIGNNQQAEQIREEEQDECPQIMINIQSVFHSSEVVMCESFNYDSSGGKFMMSPSPACKQFKDQQIVQGVRQQQQQECKDSKKSKKKPPKYQQQDDNK